MRLSCLLAVARTGAAAMVLASCALAGAADDPPTNDLRELHVVGLYEGVERTGNEIHGGRAVVTVNRPGAKVTLALVSYDSITWEVKTGPKTTVEKVILGGYYKQALKNKPESAVLVEAWRDEGRREGLSYADYKIDSPRFRGLVHELTKFSKLPISSFYGAYRYEHDKPIVIDRVQDDPRLSVDFPKPTPLAELPDLVFRTVHLVGDRRGIFNKASLGDFTLAGPVTESLKPMPDGVNRVAFDPKDKKYYGLSRHDVLEIDLTARTTSKMDLGLDVPRLSWPADIAFDSKRGRLLVVGSHGRGYLYSYDTAEKSWSVLADNPGVQAIAYHPKHDVIYGLAFPRGGEATRPRLRTLSPEGATVNETPLGDVIFPGALGSGPMTNTRLVAVDEYVVAIGSPGGFGSETTLPPTEYLYLIEAKTGKTWLTAKSNKAFAASPFGDE